MNEAFFGLLGTLVGGVITYLSARYAGDQQLKQRQMELAQQTQLAREEAARDWRRSQMTRYGEFVGAFRQEEGRIVEMLQILSSQAPDWSDLYQSKIAHPSHEAGITKLNSGLAWIELSCAEPTGITSVRELSEGFEALAHCMAAEARRKRNGDVADVGMIDKELQKLRSRFEVLCSALRTEVLH